MPGIAIVPGGPSETHSGRGDKNEKMIVLTDNPDLWQAKPGNPLIHMQAENSISNMSNPLDHL